MSRWVEFEAQAPDVAAFAHRLWPGIIALSRGDPVPSGTDSFPIAYLATVLLHSVMTVVAIVMPISESISG